jgi:hypothetical protein
MKFDLKPYLTDEVFRYGIDVVHARIDDNTYQREKNDQDLRERRMVQTAMAKIPEIIAQRIWGGHIDMSVHKKSRDDFDLVATNFHGYHDAHVKTCVHDFDEDDNSWLVNWNSRLCEEPVDEAIILAGVNVKQEYVRFVGWIVRADGPMFWAPRQDYLKPDKRAIWESMNRRVIRYF